MGGKAPAAPDYTPIAMASAQNSQLSQQFAQDQLAWAKQQYYENKPTTDRIVKMAVDNAATQQAEAKTAYDRYQSRYQPIEDKLIGQVEDWASPDRIKQQMGAAEATTQQAGAQARAASQQQLESFGINPSSTRYAAMDIANRTATGAAAAAAGTNAANLAQQQQLGLESQAINIGRGYPGQVLGEFGGATSAGSAANNAANQTFSTGSTAMNAGFGTGMSNSNNALSTWGNTLNMGYQNQLSASQQSSGVGDILGTVAGVGLKMAFPGLAEGGAVPTMGYAGAGPVSYPGSNPMPPGGTPGGAVPTGASPTQGQATDDVPAALTAGEFVIPKDVVSWEGEQFFQNLIQKDRQKMQTAKAQPSPAQRPPGPPTFASRPQGAPAIAAAGGGAVPTVMSSDPTPQNPQEQYLYDTHARNEMGPGGVSNFNGSRSTLRQMSVNVGGKTYNIPTVWGGKILPPDQALAMAKQTGLEKFPSYATPDIAEGRYGVMHQAMDRDIGNSRKLPMPAGAVSMH